MQVFIDKECAESLAKIVLRSVYGTEVAGSQSLRNATHYGDCWLVVGFSNDNTHADLVNCIFHIFINKSNAEIKGLGFNAQFKVPEAQETKWQLSAPPQQVSAWKKGTSLAPSSSEVALASILSGGVLNCGSDAVAYANVVLTKMPNFQGLDDTVLQAVERSGNWEVSDTSVPTQPPILAISRKAGLITFRT